MKKREDIPVQYTWDLTHLYASQNDWEKDLETIQELAKEIAEKKGSITTSAKNLRETLNLMDEMGKKLEWVGSYARMAFDVNMGNANSKNNFEKIDNLYTRISDQLAFYEPELLNLTTEAFEKYKQEEPELATYSFMFEKLFKEKEHILNLEGEELLARTSALGNCFKKIYDDITVNDLTFPEIEDEQGNKIPTSETYYRKTLSSYDRSLRERYFKGLLGTYGSHINSLTSVINGNVKYRTLVAKSRKYKSSREMSLTQNHIPLNVYDTLISTVRNNVHLLQRYIELRKKVLNYDSIHFYDLFVPLVQDIDKSFTLEEAQATVLDALNVLGKDYLSVLKQAFAERWVDSYPNKGKSSGAYANGVYGLHPYSLLNFTGTLEDLFTMAHELGHVMHSYYSNKNQPYVDADYVIFAAEVASTVNEYFLYRYLLNKGDSKQEKAFLLSMHLDSIRSTLYRQAFFADFEMQMHQMAESDIPLTPDELCKTYQQLYELYHGPEFTIDKELTYEWARIPHFYSSFYVYQYATGISAAISLAKGIMDDKENNLKPYLSFLGQGGSDYPITLLKNAGVNMSTSAPVIAALQDFSETLDELEGLL